MACPHGNKSTPETCSQCLGFRADRITYRDGVYYINGKRERGPHEMPENTIQGMTEASYKKMQWIKKREAEEELLDED